MAESLTRVVAIDPLHPDPAPIAEAADLIRRGELVAFPTETVYGLGANAFDATAVAKIFAAKGRPTTDPLIVHVAALEQLADVVSSAPPQAFELARRFWPGPLTLVLPRNERIPASVSAGMDTVGVRMPDHPVAWALLSAAGVPIAAPSANRFTRPSPTTAQHVLHDLDGRVGLILDGGPTTIGVESTIVSLVNPVPQVLRPGGVPIEALLPLLPNLLYQPRYLETSETAAAPGMLLKHYAPSAEVLLYRGVPGAVTTRMLATIAERQAQGQQVGVLATEEELVHFASTGALVVSLGARANLAQVAARLFAGIRELEQAGATAMLVRSFEQNGLGLAVWDRLLRATEGRIIDVP